jgi:uncharacterized membrane protein YdjX (TVP38/TMEM64 family)
MDRKKIIVLVILAVLIGLFFVFDLGRFLTLESLKANRDALRAYYEGHRAATIALFIVIYIIQTALSLPGAAVLSLAGGAVFGVFPGILYVNLGATTGATLAFLVTRYLFRDWVLKRFGARLENMNRELERRGFNYLLFLRLVPVFPFFLINLGAGLTRMPLRTFFLGTLVGIIPGSFVFCNAGASLAAITSLSEIVSFRVLGSFALLGLLALAPALYQKFRRDSDNSIMEKRDKK